VTDQVVYQHLADHLRRLGMGYPVTEALVEILKENFTPLEAEIALAIPTRIIPLEIATVDEILENVELSKPELVEILERLTQKKLLFSAKTKDGQTGYALHQVGFGFPQSFFWSGEDTPHGRKMAGMLAKYFNRHVTAEAYASETKPFRYIPVGQSLTPELQAVYPLHMMESVIEKAQVIALAHCPCRVAYGLAGKSCEHPTEVCMKFDEMARYVIDHGLAKEITREEALDVIKLTEEAGLVHFVDNSEGEIKHNCNCCGCACWNVGNIKRRKIPRDVIMATYFMRETDEDVCEQCGACADICPVDALEMGDGPPVVDEEWCIGCGVCATVCPSGAVTMKLRDDRTGHLPVAGFKELHDRILDEKQTERAG
jgi:Fe-S-cluster-containing hydrogenase component 2